MEPTSMGPGRRPMPDDDAYPGQREPPRFVRLFFTISWSSFLAAAFATLLCFAIVDPAPIGAQFSAPGEPWSRLTLYSLGFLFFWFCCAIAAALTAWMLEPRR
jgi:hypothetical protein